jgi:hypothetical protein
MLGFKSFDSASITLNGIEIVHALRKGELNFFENFATELFLVPLGFRPQIGEIGEDYHFYFELRSSFGDLLIYALKLLLTVTAFQ